MRRDVKAAKAAAPAISAPSSNDAVLYKGCLNFKPNLFRKDLFVT